MNVFTQENSLFNPLSKRYVRWDGSWHDKVHQSVALFHNQRVVQLVRAREGNIVAYAVQSHCFLELTRLFRGNNNPVVLVALQYRIDIVALRVFQDKTELLFIKLHCI